MCCWMLWPKIKEKFLTFLKSFKSINFVILPILIYSYFNVKFLKLSTCSQGLKKLNDRNLVLLLKIHIIQPFFHHHTLTVHTRYRKIFT